MGEIQSKLGNQQDAAEAFLRAVKLQESLTTDFPTEPQYKLDLAESINVLAVLRKNTNRLEDAERGFGQAIDLITGLPPEIADQPQYQHLLAGCYNNLGNVLWSVRPAAAEQAYFAQLRFMKDWWPSSLPQLSSGRAFPGRTRISPSLARGPKPQDANRGSLPQSRRPVA